MRRSTIIYVLLFLIAAGVYAVLHYRSLGPKIGEVWTPAPTTEISFLFDATDGVPTSIRIESKAGEVVEVARNAENAWALVLPFEASADQGSAEAAASQVTTMLIQDRIPNIDLEVVGLASPEYVLTIKFTSAVERKAEIGVITPSEGGYFVRNEAGEIVIVGRDSLDALLSMLTNPPYLETPTPLPSTPEPVSVETATPKP